MSKKHRKITTQTTKSNSHQPTDIQPQEEKQQSSESSTKQPFLSILVPIYNTEKYLRQCLDSLIHQTFSDLEIICINDGSTDHSLDIIKEYQAKDSRIILINKENTGYGDSMNQGLKKAQGEYIGILEPDDWIELNAYEKLHWLATTYRVDVVRANYFENKAGKDTKVYAAEAHDTERVIVPFHHTWVFYQAPAIWSAIYRRKFLTENKIDFLPTPGASYQDTGFNFKVWAEAKSVYYTTEAFLHYRTDNDSSSINNPGKVMNVCYEYESIEQFLRDRNQFEELGTIMEVAKFGAYYWNLMRLTSKLLPEFVARVKTEYQSAEEQGLLIESYYTPRNWGLITYILNHSVSSSVRHIRRHKAHRQLRKSLKKIWLTTHPSYKKQYHIVELINELCSESDVLEARINALKEIQND